MIRNARGTFTARRVLAAAAIAAASAAVLAGCAPGASGGSSSASPVSTDLGSAKITLSILIDTPGVEGMKQFGADFTKKYPNVTVQVSSTDFTSLIGNAPRTLSSGDVPDVTRANLGNLVKDKLILPLDAYAKAYGWDTWSQSQFDSSRSNAAGTVRGEGSLYAVGNGYGLTGVYYNKDLLQKLGGSVPKTLDDFEALLEKAKAAGDIGIVTNGKDGGIAYPLQNLAIDYGSASAINDWTFNKPGATIDTDAMKKAAQTIADWGAKGYFDPNVNSLDTTAAPTEFEQGNALFYTSGNWQAPGLDKAMPGKVGFMLFPSASASDPQYAMSASESLVIPAKAKHKDAAAAFLNFIQTDAAARQITVDQFGLAPAGPNDASTPKAAGLVQDTLTAFTSAVAKNGLVDFLANATTGMTNTIIPETQLLVTGRTSASDFAAKVQSDYTSQLGH